MDLLDGQPFVCYPVDPERMTRRLRWQGGLSDSVTGVESRIVRQRLPYAELSGRTAPISISESRLEEETIRAALEAGRCAWVDWACPSTILSRAGNVLTLDSAADISGSHIWFFHPRGLAIARKITAVSGNNVTIDNASGLLPGDLAYPVRWGHIGSQKASAPAVGEGIRSFDLTLVERPQLAPIDSTFKFWKEDLSASWLSILANLYFLFFIDTSGSMDADVPNVTATANVLKVLLRDRVYGGDQAKADHFVRVQNWSSERWLDRLAYRVSGEEAARYVSLAFINEANNVYHRTPRDASYEPTDSFGYDYGLFLTEYERREISRGKVYSINPTQSAWLADNLAFNAHLAAAIDGLGGYAALGTPLKDLDVTYQVGVASGTTAEWYLTDILNLMGVRA